jgi:GR25 family glycosyltransferase involved in LPS biosynthesis
MGASNTVPSDTHGWNSIDHFYYINLASRKDREQEFKTECKTIGIPPEKLIKIDASVDKLSPFQACTRSHIRALQKSLASNDRWCIIFEDDFKLNMKIDKAKYLISKFFQDFPGANVLMLEINPLVIHRTHSTGIYQVEKGLAMAGYMVRGEYIPKMLRCLQESYRTRQPFDVGIFKLQAKDHWYALQPAMGIQRPSYSDIERRNVNYGV